MRGDREQCAANALSRSGNLWGLTTADLLAKDNGHHFYDGWHVSWAWGMEAEGGFIDILSEHRMVGMIARRVFSDGSTKSLDTPHEFRLEGATPEEDERLLREYLEYNRRVLATLQSRGLLPPESMNADNQESGERL